MKCFLHRSEDAIGVCVKCGTGLCSKCAVIIEDKIFCRVDAETTQTRKNREPVITILSIIFYIFGVVEIATGLSLLSLASIASSIYFYTGHLALFTMSLGIGIVIIGVVDFLAGRWLWRTQRRGGILGMITAAIGIALNTIFMSVEPLPSIFGIILSAVVIALIAVGWKHLR